MTSQQIAEAKSKLPDVQEGADNRGVALEQAGIRNAEIPFYFQQNGGERQWVQALATMTVGLKPETKGVNMSRFMTSLAEWSQERTFSLNMRPLLEEVRERLESESAHMKLAFKYFVNKPAPVTGLAAPMAHDIIIESSLVKNGNKDVYTLKVHFDLISANCCPCSKAIADGQGAHNQRVRMNISLLMHPTQDISTFSLEKFIDDIENAPSSPVFPMLKRPDEKWVTERQYQNPKFVEDVARDAAVILTNYPGVLGYNFEVEAQESIHRHNAYAQTSENYA